MMPCAQATITSVAHNQTAYTDCIFFVSFFNAIAKFQVPTESNLFKKKNQHATWEPNYTIFYIYIYISDSYDEKEMIQCTFGKQTDMLTHL